MGNVGQARCLGQGTRHRVIPNPSADLQPGPCFLSIMSHLYKRVSFHADLWISQSLPHSPRTPKNLWKQHTAVEVMCAWQGFEGLLEQGQQILGW